MITLEDKIKASYRITEIEIEISRLYSGRLPMWIVENKHNELKIEREKLKRIVEG